MMQCGNTLSEHVAFANALIQTCQEYTVRGIVKLNRRIQAELRFLKSLEKACDDHQDSHLKSSNLMYLQAIVSQLSLCSHPQSLLEKFSVPSGSVTVDIVCCHGNHWVKVVARKASAVEEVWRGRGEHGQRSVTEQAQELMDAAQQHPHMYRVPRVTLVFYQGVTECVSSALQDLGVTVVQPPHTDCHNAPDPGHLNVDVSSLLTMVSELSHGGVQCDYKDSVLQFQAACEQAEPVMPHIQQLTSGQSLTACTTAIDSFLSIVDLLAGPSEKQRAAQLLQRVKQVPDQPSARVGDLQISTKVKDRAKVIFGTGDCLKYPTLTANASFVRSAREQGVELCVLLHEPRALSERKQITRDQENERNQLTEVNGCAGDQSNRSLKE